MQSTTVGIRVFFVCLLINASQCFDMSSFRKQLIEHYNFLRSLHDAPPLKIDPALDNSAAQWARHLSTFSNDKCLYHSRDGGENIYFIWATDTITETELARQAAKAFYEEWRYYDYSRPGMTVRASHFTNLVWRSVERMGIGVFINDYTTRHGACNVVASKNRPARGYMVVVHQWPPSNIMTSDEFKANVLRPKKAFSFS